MAHRLQVALWCHSAFGKLEDNAVGKEIDITREEPRTEGEPWPAGGKPVEPGSLSEKVWREVISKGGKITVADIKNIAATR